MSEWMTNNEYVKRTFHPIWEKFSGKPYKKHKASPGTIKEAVKESQDILAKSYLGLNRRTLSDYWTYWPGFHGGDTSKYPQSLGELCIELAQDAYQAYSVGEKLQLGDVLIYSDSPVSGELKITRRDIQDLRRAMWNRVQSVGKTRKPGTPQGEHNQ